MNTEETETAAPGKIPGKPYAGAFAAWLRDARKARHWTQGDVASATGLSASWVCRLETGDSFPNEIDRDKLILGLDFARTNEALDAWRADRKQIDRADTKGLHPFALFRSRDERRTLGEEQRVKILQIVAKDWIERGVAPMASMISGRMTITTASVVRHIRRLERDGLLAEERFSVGTAHLRITPEGLAHALRCGEESGTWTQPFAHALALHRIIGQHLLAREGLAEPPVEVAGPVQAAAHAHSLSGPEPLYLAHGETPEMHAARAAEEGAEEPYEAPYEPEAPPVLPPPDALLHDRWKREEEESIRQAIVRTVLTADETRVLRAMAALGRPMEEEEIAAAAGLSVGEAYAVTETLLEKAFLDFPPHEGKERMEVTPARGHVWLEAYPA